MFSELHLQYMKNFHKTYILSRMIIYGDILVMMAEIMESVLSMLHILTSLCKYLILNQECTNASESW